MEKIVNWPKENMKSVNMEEIMKIAKDAKMIFIWAEKTIYVIVIEQGPFYKCAISDSKEERCTQCIDNYYLGYLDDKCTTMEGCDLSENKNNILNVMNIMQ